MPKDIYPSQSVEGELNANYGCRKDIGQKLHVGEEIKTPTGNNIMFTFTYICKIEYRMVFVQVHKPDLLLVITASLYSCLGRVMNPSLMLLFLCSYKVEGTNGSYLLIWSEQKKTSSISKTTLPSLWIINVSENVQYVTHQQI